MTIFYVPPSLTFVPSFSPTLDGDIYNCRILWNISAQRYYIMCIDLNNNLIFMVPIIGSMPGILIESLTWDPERQIINGICSESHHIPLGSSCYRTILNSSPVDYGGTRNIWVTGATTFAYEQLTDPDLTNCGCYKADVGGSLNQLINICGGFFDSIMIYRGNQFEVFP